MNIMNLETAWIRTKLDIRGQYHLRNPYEINLVDIDSRSWLEMIWLRLSNGTYRPSPSEAIQIPKVNWNVRTIMMLRLEDILVYQALVLDCIDAISSKISWSAMSNRFSCILNEEQNADRWFVNEIRSWTQFTKEMVKRMDTGTKYVVYADVAEFFSNIDHQLLIRDLRDAGARERTCSLLSECLKCWMQPIHKGIPQNLRPSNLLADLYMDEIDRLLVREGLNYIRYTDDLRIFCQSKREAIDAIAYLTAILRNRGLSIQTAKTRIVLSADAGKDASYVDDMIRKIGNDISKELSIPSGLSLDMRQFISITRQYHNLKAIRKAFNRYFGRSKDFTNKSLFHFVINRLGVAGDEIAVEYCLNLLKERPEESIYILDGYFAKIRGKQLSKRLAVYVLSGEIPYDYQIFLIMKWLYRYGTSTKLVLQAARHIVDSELPDYIRNYGIAVLGKFGDEEEFDYIMCHYDNSASEIFRTTVVYSLCRMSAHKRDRFYSSIQRDGWFIERTIRWMSSRPLY